MLLLKRHPFAVEAHFRQSLVLTFALPKSVLEGLLPPPLSLDVFGNTYAFVAVAMVQTEALRPAGFPKWMGSDFFLAGYRIFVRYENRAGKRLRGLYILESQTDKEKMRFFGNLMTHYKYRRITVREKRTADNYRVDSPSEGFSVGVRYTENAILPSGSPFRDWKEARRYAGPLPFTFTFAAGKVIIVRGVRQNWQPKPVTVEECTVPWLRERGFGKAILASAFVVEDIPYRWEKGALENWPR